MTAHTPVLFDAVMRVLNPQPGQRFIDGTVGAGGHAHGLLTLSAPTGHLLGLDRDPHALTLTAARLREFGDRARLMHCSYLDMAEAASGFAPVDGILLDLGLSSMQVDDPARGFAFRHDGPLDMRFDPAAPLTAADIVNTWREDELADVLFEYGEERQSRRVARAIVNARPLRTTMHLADVVARALGGQRRGHIHPATRTFQALRIAVNEELAAVQEVLPLAWNLLRSGGVLAVISFHSLEDRLVKHFMRDLPHADRLTRKPIEADEAEATANPRARSAKLRAVRKLTTDH